MTDDLAQVFARIHADYRAAVAMTVHNLPDEALAAAEKELQPDKVPDELWGTAPMIRVLIGREKKRRQEAAKEEQA